MSIVLHRFPLSHFSEKVRAVLEFKKLEYSIVEHMPGRDQVALYRLSGQRKVPVVEHDGQVIHDSTAIALHIERAYPEERGVRRALLPDDMAMRREVLELEDRLDETLGKYVPLLAVKGWMGTGRRFDAIAKATLRVGGVAFQGVRALGLFSRAALLLPAARRPLDEAEAAVRAQLAELVARLDRSPFLVGDQPTLADVAAVGLTFHLKIPKSRRLAVEGLEGVGIDELTEDPALSRFFAWRDSFYAQFLG